MTVACGGPSCGGTPTPDKNTVGVPRSTLLLVIAVTTAITFGGVAYVITAALALAAAAAVTSFLAVQVGAYFGAKFAE